MASIFECDLLAKLTAGLFDTEGAPPLVVFDTNDADLDARLCLALKLILNAPLPSSSSSSPSSSLVLLSLLLLLWLPSVRSSALGIILLAGLFDSDVGFDIVEMVDSLLLLLL